MDGRGRRQKSGLVQGILVLALLCLLAPAGADTGSAGTDLCLVQTLGLGARPDTLGGLPFVGLADDASAAFWNAAALPFQTRRETNTLYSNLYFQNIHFAQAALALPLHTFGAEGFARQMGLGLTVSQLYDVQEQTAADSPVVTGKFVNSQTLVTLGAGWRPNGLLGLGLNLKGLYLTAADFSAPAFGLDLSALVQPWDGLRFGLLGQNVVPFRLRHRYDAGFDMSAPRVVAAGSLRPVARMVFLGEADYTFRAGTFADNLHYAVGMEAEVARYVFLRGSFEPGILLVGGGLNFRVYQFDVGYAFPYGEKSGVTRLAHNLLASLTVRF